MNERDTEREILWPVRPTINPYLHAAHIVFQRIRWDLRRGAWMSRTKLKTIRNSFEGKKALVMCNGPSLNRVDFSRLHSVFSFGMNKINLLFERSAFRPNCIVAINDLVLEQNSDFFAATDIPLFLAHSAYSRLGLERHICYLYMEPSYKLAKDCSISVCPGATVTSVALQLAFHHGFRDVGIVGCDHSFQAKGTANATVCAGAQDQSHFDPRYFAGNVKWQLPDLPASEFYYHMAKRMFESEGKRIVNCTDGGELEIFDRMPLEQWLKA